MKHTIAVTLQEGYSVSIFVTDSSDPPLDIIGPVTYEPHDIDIGDGRLMPFIIVDIRFVNKKTKSYVPITVMQIRVTPQMPTNIDYNGICTIDCSDLSDNIVLKELTHPFFKESDVWYKTLHKDLHHYAIGYVPVQGISGVVPAGLVGSSRHFHKSIKPSTAAFFSRAVKIVCERYGTLAQLSEISGYLLARVIQLPQTAKMYAPDEKRTRDGKITPSSEWSLSRMKVSCDCEDYSLDMQRLVEEIRNLSAEDIKSVPSKEQKGLQHLVNEALSFDPYIVIGKANVDGFSHCWVYLKSITPLVSSIFVEGTVMADPVFADDKYKQTHPHLFVDTKYAPVARVDAPQSLDATKNAVYTNSSDAIKTSEESSDEEDWYSSEEEETDPSEEYDSNKGDDTRPPFGEHYDEFSKKRFTSDDEKVSFSFRPEGNFVSEYFYGVSVIGTDGQQYGLLTVESETHKILGASTSTMLSGNKLELYRIPCDKQYYERCALEMGRFMEPSIGYDVPEHSSHKKTTKESPVRLLYGAHEGEGKVLYIAKGVAVTETEYIGRS